MSTGDRVRVDAALEVGTLSETVQVTGEAPLLQTDTSRVASLVSERMVQDAPIQGRNIINFIQLTPGASEGNANATTSGNRPDDRRQTSAVSIMGAAENDNSQLIDGMDNTERVQAGMGIKPSIDAIAEVLVQTNNYSAENGRTLAGVINIITKSGGNRFSGSAFEFTRHERFDAKNFFATSNDKPLNRLHQFGGSLGGPIKANQTFFFVDYDQNRIRKGVTSVVTVPTMKMRSGDFSEVPAVIYDPLTIPRTPFPGNQIPANRIEPLAAKLFALYPAPTSPGLANNFAMEQRVVADQPHDGRAGGPSLQQQRQHLRPVFLQQDDRAHAEHVPRSRLPGTEDRSDVQHAGHAGHLLGPVPVVRAQRDRQLGAHLQPDTRSPR